MKNIEQRLGKVELFPGGPVTAGQMMEWTITYTAGSYGVDEGGVIMLLQRIAADIQPPQFELPGQPAFTTVATTADCLLSCRFQKKQHQRPWQKWGLIIDVEDGSLSPGDTITIVLGDRSQGSPGIRAQTFVESKHEFRILVDPTNAAAPVPLPSSPIFPVIAGEAESLICIMPAQMTVGESAEIFVKGEDTWGNPTQCPADIVFSSSGTGEGKIADGKITAITAGILYLEARSGDMFCKSNPIQIVDKELRYSRYWGDLHAQTDSTVGTGTEEEYFLFARDQARLDYTSHQGNDFQLTDNDWKLLNEVIKKYHKDGDFVVFPGYEWSGNSCAGGDHNVIYLHEDQPLLRSSHWQIPEIPENEMTPAHPVDDLFRKLKGIGNVMVIPHVGGRYANVRKYFDPAIEHCVEILSCHGIFEWLLWDALEKGHQVGVVCNSDGHKGRPGAEGPGAGQFGIHGGLTCVLAEEKSRKAIFNALQARRCYGTTGARIHLEFSADDHLMGEVFTAEGSVTIVAKAYGTAPMEKLVLLCGCDEVHVVRPESFTGAGNSCRIRISWQGARIRGRARRAVWDGYIQANGTRILNARPFAFDSPAHGIVNQDESHVAFTSSTVGDVDGIDLFLDRGERGSLFFDSKIGQLSIDLSKLGVDQKVFDFGGLDLMVKVQRYPVQMDLEPLSLEYEATLQAGKVNPFLIKAVQEDGQIAWSSPIYITSRI